MFLQYIVPFERFVTFVASVLLSVNLGTMMYSKMCWVQVFIFSSKAALLTLVEEFLLMLCFDVLLQVPFT